MLWEWIIWVLWEWIWGALRVDLGALGVDLIWVLWEWIWALWGWIWMGLG